LKKTYELHIINKGHIRDLVQCGDEREVTNVVEIPELKRRRRAADTCTHATTKSIRQQRFDPRKLFLRVFLDTSRIPSKIYPTPSTQVVILIS
jgi:hypothetical protein